MVLVDPTPEEFGAALRDLAASLGTPVPAASADPSVDETSFQQMREARSAGPLRSMPLIVLTHGRAADPGERPPGWPLAEEERIWTGLHDEIVRLVPGARRIVAEASGHDIHQEQPDLVVAAILAVVAAVRDPGAWGTPVATPTD